MKLRKLVSVFLFVTMLGGLLAGCTQKADNTDAKPTGVTEDKGTEAKDEGTKTDDAASEGTQAGGTVRIMMNVTGG